MVGIVGWPVRECDIGKSAMKSDAEQHCKSSQRIQIMEPMRGSFYRLLFYRVHDERVSDPSYDARWSGDDVCALLRRRESQYRAACRLIRAACLNLQNQHAIAIAEKTVLFCDGGFVGLYHLFASGEGGHHHEQGRFRQVEVG